MKATLVAKLPVGPEWFYEAKLDGYRAEALKDGERVKLFSSRGNDFTGDFPEVANAVKTIKAKSALLDGEIIAVDPQGRHSFQTLQSRSATPRGFQIVFYAFDLLYLGGDSLLTWPIEKRKQHLERVVGGSRVLLSPELDCDPAIIESNIRAFGLEGIIAKRRGSNYEPANRSGAWQKYKTSPAQEFVVAGFKSDGPKLESLLVGFYKDKKLKFAGKVRAGLTPRNRRTLADRLVPLIVSKCPLTELKIVKSSQWSGGLTEEDLAIAKWVKPKLVVQVAFVEWTKDSFLRHPKFIGIREDKRASEVIRESEST
jgi:bifunctional non-homologous end joining protein LigD